MKKLREKQKIIQEQAQLIKEKEKESSAEGRNAKDKGTSDGNNNNNNNTLFKCKLHHMVPAKKINFGFFLISGFISLPPTGRVRNWW